MYFKITKEDKKATQNFYNKIPTSDNLITLKCDLKENPNNTYNVLHNVIQDAKNKHMPSKLITLYPLLHPGHAIYDITCDVT